MGGEGHRDRLHGRAEDGDNVDTGRKIFETKNKIKRSNEPSQKQDCLRLSGQLCSDNSLICKVNF